MPLGSLTKAFTIAGVVQHIEKGNLNWNDTVEQYISKIIKSDTGKSLEELFDKRYIHEVTIYQLVFMTSGIKDYDDKKLLAL